MDDLVRFAIDRELDITFIEEMPLGVISEHERGERSVPVTRCAADRRAVHPDRVRRVDPGPVALLAPGRAPQTPWASFRPTATTSAPPATAAADGRRALLLCLGNEHSVDFKAVLRAHPGNAERLQQAIGDGCTSSPTAITSKSVATCKIVRFMNMTGG